MNKKVKSIIIVLIIVQLCLVIYDATISSYEVKGISMENTLHSRDKVFAIRTKDVHEGDIVVFYTAENKDLSIKRCIGVPGDVIKIYNGQVYVNGKVLKEDYTIGYTDSGMLENEIKLKDGQYIMLGDNRENSYDSRNYGIIGKNNIVGVVIE